jgi:hypothetical protein
MQTRITSIGKRIPLKLSISICPGFGTAVYSTGPFRSLMRQNTAAAWLDPATPPEMVEEIVRFAALEPDTFAWHAVGRAIGNLRNQGPELVAPVNVWIYRR